MKTVCISFENLISSIGNLVCLRIQWPQFLLVMPKCSIRMATIILALLVAGCGGGGSSPDIATAPIEAGNAAGQIFIGSEVHGPRLLNLQTGRYTLIENFDWEERLDDDFLLSFSASISADGSEFLETVGNCQRRTNSLIADDCIVIRDRNGVVTGGFVVPLAGGLGVARPAKLSPDRQVIAAAVDFDGSDFLHRLYLFDRSGQILSQGNIDGLVDGDYFTWLPDNSIIFASEQSLYLTAPNSVQGAEIVTFPDAAGFPDHLAISPDGNRLAFSLVTNRDPYEGEVWILNLDGTGFVRPAITDTEGSPDPNGNSPILGGAPRLRSPTWSPDGSSLLLVQGSSPLQYAFIVPADANEEVLALDQPTQAVRIESFFLRDVNGIESAAPGPLFSDTGPNITWIP